MGKKVRGDVDGFVLQTEWNGVLYRSRLEARWAAFFDTLGVRFEYEPEGYELESGRYLPDFFLPVANVLVEVKGDERRLTPEYIGKLHDVAGASRRLVVVLGPVPDWRWFGGKAIAHPLLAHRGMSPPMIQFAFGDPDVHAGVASWQGPLTSARMFEPHMQCAPGVLAALDAARNERFGVHPKRS